MKIIVMIPYWHGYEFPEEGLANRNDLKVAGYTLIDRAIRVAQSIKSVSDVVVYASSDKVLNLLKDPTSCTFMKRDSSLDSQEASIEDIVERFLQNSDADIIVLMHPRCPFIKQKTISECIDKVANKSVESSFVGSSFRKLAWFKNKPLNYSLESGKNTPNLSSIEPVIIESSAVYVFTRKLFEKTRRRVCGNPFIQITGPFEGFEVNTVDDYAIAELIVNAGLDAGNKYS